MNTTRTLKWGLVTAAATCAVVAAMPGCELLVDFDRSKIPSEAGAEDVTTSDSPVTEGGQETSTDAPSEASEAGMMDAPPETTTEAGMDAKPEAAPDGGDGGDGAAAMAIFAITPTSVSYGTVALGTTTAAYTFTVTNSGTVAGTPTITKGGTNAADFTAAGCTASVAAGGNCTLSVTFLPGAAGARGPATFTVGSSVASVTGTGATAGSLTISPTTLSFGTVNSGTSSTPSPVTVTNTDATNAVTLTLPPTIDGKDSAKFGVDDDGGTGQCGATLAASGQCTLYLHFAPTATGFQYASVSITGTGAGTPGTASASLTGTGQ
jgi:hypothetical protein